MERTEISGRQGSGGLRSREEREKVTHEVAQIPSALEGPLETTLKSGNREQIGSNGPFLKDIVAESYSLATRESTDASNENLQNCGGDPGNKNGDLISKQRSEVQSENKNFIQLESCGLHTIYSDRGHASQQQGEYIAEPAATFLGHHSMWQPDPTFGSRVTHEERYPIPNELSPTYIQPQGVFVKAKPLQMHGVRQHSNEQLIQGPSNTTMGYLRCVDQNMIIRPLEMRSYDGSQPILIEDEDTLEGEDNEVDENEHSSDSSSKRGPKKKNPKKPKIKRPMNAFMVWAKKNRPILAKNFPGMTNADISVMLGEKWSSMSPDQKQPFFDEADKIRNQHRKDHPDWTYQPKPKRRRIGNAANSFYFEVTKNTQGGYITRHINELVVQQIPAFTDQNGKTNMKMMTGNSGVHYMQNPLLQSNDPSSSGNSFGGANVVPVCLGAVKYPGNVLTGGVLVAQPAPVPGYAPAQGNMATSGSVAQRPYSREEGSTVPQQAKQQ